jgi:predicted RNA-binding Zn ribbon-like protein
MPDDFEPTAEATREEELFVRFANTFQLERGEPVERLPDVDALLGWLRDADLISNRARAAEAGRLRRAPEEAERRLQRFRRLRDVLRSIARDIGDHGTPGPAHLGELNHILRHGLHYHQLRHAAGGTTYSVAQVGDRLDQARAAIAGSFAHFLAAGGADRLRICANDGCRYLFVDRSPAGRRRWCDMRTCGNQAKVARHRARHRSPQAGTDAGVPAAGASV